MCSKGTAKCILIIFNTIFFVLGAAVLALGIFVLVDKSSMLSALSKIPSVGETVQEAADKTSILQGSAYVLIGAGACVFVIGFCGCCGALKESRCLLLIYALLVLIILFAQIAAGVVAYFFKDKVDVYLQDFLDKTIKEHYTGATFTNDGKLGESIEPISAAWDFGQAYFECCGNNAHTDWLTATKWDRSYSATYKGVLINFEAKVPVTCCKMKDPSKFPTDIDNVEFENLERCLRYADSDVTNQKGCYNHIWDLMSTYSTICIAVGITVGCVEALGIICACYLARAIKKENEVQKA